MKPLYVKTTPININGIETNRLMIILKTRGCSFARRTGGCIMCGFFKQADKNITETQMKQQLGVLDLTNFNDIKEIDLLTCGSFYDENEISEKFREYALNKISQIRDIIKVTTESRTEYLNAKKLKKDREILGEKIYEIAIGLESSNNHIRNSLIKKGLSKRGFENAVKILGKSEVSLLSYVLIKPPGVTEKEAIDDAIKTAKYAFKIGEKYNVPTKVAFEPIFICHDTPLEKLYIEGKYKILNLWSVVEVIMKTHKLGNIFVGLDDENLSQRRIPKSCEKCNRKILNEIKEFNKTQDISCLKKIVCSCKREYKKNLNKSSFSGS